MRVELRRKEEELFHSALDEMEELYLSNETFPRLRLAPVVLQKLQSGFLFHYSIGEIRLHVFPVIDADVTIFRLSVFHKRS